MADFSYPRRFLRGCFSEIRESKEFSDVRFPKFLKLFKFSFCCRTLTIKPSTPLLGIENDTRPKRNNTHPRKNTHSLIGIENNTRHTIVASRLKIILNSPTYVICSALEKIGCAIIFSVQYPHGVLFVCEKFSKFVVLNGKL